MNLSQAAVNTRSLVILCGLIVSLALSAVHGGELVRVTHQVSKIPEKRVHIHVTASELRLDGVRVTKDQISQRLSELSISTLYCEVDKKASIPKARIEDWASLVLESGGRFFYKQHRSAIDSVDRCFEYKETEQAGHGDGE